MVRSVSSSTEQFPRIISASLWSSEMLLVCYSLGQVPTIDAVAQLCTTFHLGLSINLLVASCSSKYNFQNKEQEVCWPSLKCAMFLAAHSFTLGGRPVTQRVCAVTSSLLGKALGREFCCYSAAFPKFVLRTRQIRFEPMTVSLLEFLPPRTPSWLQHFTSATNQHSAVLSCMAVQLESVNWLPTVTLNYKSTVREFSIGVDSTSSIKTNSTSFLNDTHWILR